MNDNEIREELALVTAPASNFYIDAEGNRVEIPFEVPFEGNDGYTYAGSDSETAQSETAFIAEDAADHAVTVH